MGRHSVFDAFQAAAGAADAVLGEIDKQKRAEAAIEIQDAQLKNMEAFNQFMIDVQNSNDWENYEKNWESFKVKAYNEGSKSLSSPYAKRIYESSFKNEEMKQRLMVKGIADQKRRLITVTKGFDSINNLITSNSFQDMEVEEEGGTKFIKTASMQKKEKIDEIAYNLYEAGLLKYDEFNEFQRKAYSTLLTHEMVSAGKKSVDSLMSLEEVNSKMQEFQGEYRLPAGGYVSASALRATAQEEVKSYYYEQQKIRHNEGEQRVSRIYAKQVEALARGDWEAAYKIAESGRAAITQRDTEYKGDGFSANVRDEYMEKFMLKNDFSIGGQYGGLAKMSADDESYYWQSVMKNGIKQKDGSSIHPTFSEVVSLLNGEVLEAKTKVLGSREQAIVNTYKTLSKLTEAISKPPFCNQGVSASIKNIESALKQVFSKNKDFSTLEGQEKYNRVLGETIAQVYNYIESTPFDEQKPEDVANILACQAIKLGKKKTIGNYFYNNEEEQARDAAEIAARNKETKTGTFGEDLQSPEGRANREELLNYVVRQEKDFTGFTTEELKDKFLIDINDDNSVVFRDKNTKEAVAVYSSIIDENGEETYKRHTVSYEDKDGEKTPKVTLDKKTPGQMKKEREDEEKKTRAFNRRNDSIGKTDTLIPGRKRKVDASEGYKKYVYNLNKEDRALFEKVVKEMSEKEDFKNGKVSPEQQEKRIIEEFEERKKNRRTRRF